MRDRGRGRPNWDLYYNCAKCDIRIPKTESNYCPDCGQLMRTFARNTLKRREAQGLIKRI